MGNDAGRTKEENLSQNYAVPAIAARQRELVDQQLLAMHEGLAPQHFTTIGTVLNRISAADMPINRHALLDVGCGSAYYSEIMGYFAPSMIDYTGCDYNPGMVAMAQERYPGLPIVQVDARDLKDFETGQFDIVLSSALIIHVREWQVVIKELARVANEWLILHRTWVHTDGTPTTREVRDAYGQQVWYQTFNDAMLIEAMYKLGFDLIDNYPTGEGIRRGQVLTYLFRKRT